MPPEDSGIHLLNGSRPSGPRNTPWNAPTRTCLPLGRASSAAGPRRDLARGGADPRHRDVAGHRRLRDRHVAAPEKPRPEKARPEKARPAATRARRPRSSGLRLDHGQRRAWTDGREIDLTFQEFELLAFLSAHPATVFTRADLIEQVWRRAIAPDGQAIARDSRTVDVHVSRVRHKLGPRYGQCLVTEYRVGYQFRPLAP